MVPQYSKLKENCDDRSLWAKLVRFSLLKVDTYWCQQNFVNSADPVLRNNAQKELKQLGHDYDVPDEWVKYTWLKVAHDPYMDFILKPTVALLNSYGFAAGLLLFVLANVVIAGVGLKLDPIPYQLGPSRILLSCLAWHFVLTMLATTQLSVFFRMADKRPLYPMLSIFLIDKSFVALQVMILHVLPIGTMFFQFTSFGQLTNFLVWSSSLLTATHVIFCIWLLPRWGRDPSKIHDMKDVLKFVVLVCFFKTVLSLAFRWFHTVSDQRWFGSVEILLARLPNMESRVVALCIQFLIEIIQSAVVVFTMFIGEWVAPANGEASEDLTFEPSKPIVGTAFRTNTRAYMEDAAQTADWDDDASHPMHGLYMLAIFDGHGGPMTANWLKDNVKAKLSDKANELFEGMTDTEEQQVWRASSGCVFKPAQIENLLKESFLSMDRAIRKEHIISKWNDQGATVAVVLISRTHVISANCGDSRALLWKLDGGGDPRYTSCPRSNARTMIVLTEDHKPGDTVEKERIEAVNGYSVVAANEGPERQLIHRIQIEGWAMPNLNLSRALGDYHCKPKLDNPKDGSRVEDNPISPVPFTKSVLLASVGGKALTSTLCGKRSEIEQCFCLVVASDGVVNERFENKQIVNAVQDGLKSKWKSLKPTNGQDFLERAEKEGTKDCVDSLLTTTEHSNWGDNQSAHIAILRRRIGPSQEVEKGTVESQTSSV